jgi:hypothetical protein
MKSGFPDFIFVRAPARIAPRIKVDFETEIVSLLAHEKLGVAGP